MQQEVVPQSLVGRPLLQEVLAALRQLPDRDTYEQLLRRIDAVEGIAQRAAERPDAAARLAPILADLRSAVHVEIMTAVEQVSQRVARTAVEQVSALSEPADPEAVAGAVDRRMQGARERAERRIDARFTAVEKQLSDLCERLSAAAAAWGESAGAGPEALAAATEAIAAMNGRLERIERVLAGRDPLLTNLGAELRSLHTRLAESDALLREAVADSMERTAQRAAERAVRGNDRPARLSVSAAAVDAGRGAGEADSDVPGAIGSYLEAARPATRRSRWSSAALLAVTVAVIAVPMVIAWQDIGTNLTQQTRDWEVIRPNLRPAEQDPAPPDESAGRMSDESAEVSDL